MAVVVVPISGYPTKVLLIMIKTHIGYKNRIL